MYICLEKDPIDSKREKTTKRLKKKKSCLLYLL